MAKIKLTKGELKRQRDALRRYERYLPTLQLKKQQLQIEILHQLAILQERMDIARTKEQAIAVWAGLLADENVDLRAWVQAKGQVTTSRNVAGVDLPVFQHLEFAPAEYDLFIIPLWVDTAVEELRVLARMRAEIAVLQEAIAILRQELRIATQRVNLFEKIKIPEAREVIRLIKIFLGDQTANAVGRSKIAKRKIEQAELVGV